jgi:hypothetical protein
MIKPKMEEIHSFILFTIYEEDKDMKEGEMSGACIMPREPKGKKSLERPGHK